MHLVFDRKGVVYQSLETCSIKIRPEDSITMHSSPPKSRPTKNASKECKDARYLTNTNTAKNYWSSIREEDHDIALRTITNQIKKQSEDNPSSYLQLSRAKLLIATNKKEVTF